MTQVDQETTDWINIWQVKYAVAAANIYVFVFYVDFRPDRTPYHDFKLNIHIEER